MAIQESFDLPKAKLAGLEMLQIGRLEQNMYSAFCPTYLLRLALSSVHDGIHSCP